MGGPSYATPYPVKRQTGNDIIWDWGKRDWIPYDRSKADAARAQAAADTQGTQRAVGGDVSEGAPTPAGEPAAPAPSAPSGEPPGDPSGGRSFAQTPQLPQTGGAASQARRGMPSRRYAYSQNPIGRSLLSSDGERGNQ